MPRPTISLGSRGNAVKDLQAALSLITDGIFGPITEEAVKDYQRSRYLTPDGIVGPKTWAALGITPDITVIAASRRIDEIILHCTATPEGHDYTVDQVRSWHVDGNGWSDIGYHFLIHLDGRVSKGRPIDKIGAHCTGHNSHSIGVCYVGGCEADGKTPKDTRTPAQRQSLRILLDILKDTYPGIAIHCHNEFAAKACPSFTIDSL